MKENRVCRNNYDDDDDNNDDDDDDDDNDDSIGGGIIIILIIIIIIIISMITMTMTCIAPIGTLFIGAEQSHIDYMFWVKC